PDTRRRLQPVAEARDSCDPGLRLRARDDPEPGFGLNLLEGGGDGDRPALRLRGNGGHELAVADDLEAALDAAEAHALRRGETLAVERDVSADPRSGGRHPEQAQRLDEVVHVHVPLGEAVAEGSARSLDRA